MLRKIGLHICRTSKKTIVAPIASIDIYAMIEKKVSSVTRFGNFVHHCLTHPSYDSAIYLGATVPLIGIAGLFTYHIIHINMDVYDILYVPMARNDKITIISVAIFLNIILFCTILCYIWIVCRVIDAYYAKNID